MSFERNTKKSGCEVVEWLYNLGIKKTILQFIGKNPLSRLSVMNIDCFCIKENTTKLVDVLNNLNQNNLTKIVSKNKNMVINDESDCSNIN